ncbi:two-component response regulator-like PRR73 [Zingiber officinale]|uniref:two-component response regulator-like PRR73 n=1 Tax=Zingiber officinale TaxID=94328 RepID=UPI001C4AB767|nr:two-component response regulator-like PRR73 [Zingiber officinale]
MKPSTPFTVRAAANGLQAWEIIEDLSNHVDLVLTEVFLPGLCGVTLLSKIMSHKACKNIPVIMMSSNDSIGTAFKCLTKGAVDFLVKPIRKNELKNLWQLIVSGGLSSGGGHVTFPYRLEEEFLHKMCNGCGGSCSPPDNSSEARKESSTYNMISSSNAAPLKQGSNGSSNNNEMCTTTRNVFTKPKSNKEETAFNYIRTTAVLHPKQIRTSTNQQIVHEKVQHHHHHHHHHHLHVHDMSQQLQSPDPDDLPPNMAAPASQCWSSNAFIEPFEETSSRLGVGDANGNRSSRGVVQMCFSQREAALKKFREKRKERNFVKKVRYQSRKILAEQRPRVRGQFVRQTVHEKNKEVQLLLNMNKSSVSSKGNQIKAVNKNAAGNNSQVKHKIWGMKISEASIPVGFKSTFCQNRSHTTYGHEKAPQVSRIPCFT